MLKLFEVAFDELLIHLVSEKLATLLKLTVLVMVEIDVTLPIDDYESEILELDEAQHFVHFYFEDHLELLAVGF